MADVETTIGDTWPLKVKLRKAVMRDGELTKELSFREPTAGDIDSCGALPVVIDFETGKFAFDAPRMSRLLSHLAAVPPSSIKAMDTRDWTSIWYQFARFFFPDQETT